MNGFFPMRRLVPLLGALWLGGIAAAQTPVVPSRDVLSKPFGAEDERAFAAPGKVFYPETWFHYIGGNVSPEGITADLEAIAAAGFSGVQLFHGQFGGIWPGTERQIACLSPDWDEAVRHTALECRRLGLRFTMQGCPGWAMAGGPWITPDKAMRHLVWSRTDVTAGTRDVVLPLPESAAEQWRDYRDVAVVAFPTPLGDTGRPLVPAGVESNRSGNWDGLLRGDAVSAINLSPAPAGDPCLVEVTFPEETVVRTLEFPSVNSLNHGWCYDPGVGLKMQAVLPDGSCVDVLDTELPRGNWQDDRPVSLACSEVSGVRKYRLAIDNRHDVALQSLRLFSAARKNNWESEAAWTLRSIERRGQSAVQSAAAWVPESGIADLTECMADDGRLRWTAPEGRWTVLRIGHVNTGMRNGPAPAEGTGWECDKLSTAGADAQFDGYIGRLTAGDGPLGGGLLDGLLFDSWECKTQTWTPAMEEEFARRAGYALRPWIPALFGYVVGDPGTTARFLDDWRRVLGEMLTENFFGRMAGRARERGLSITYETAAGDVFPTDILEYYRHADVPMCEFWQPVGENFVGSLNFKPIRPAASAARLYGKPRVAAEAFTSVAHTWDEDFRLLKAVADRNMAEGVTHPVFHTYTHNPQVGFLPPGTSFSGAGIGTPFLRGQTWWRHMPEFTIYLARCGYMLERGVPVSDVLWYLGDEVDHKPDQNSPFPEGYGYDYCNPDVLLHRLSVERGYVVTPEGIRYRVLWLPETTRMLPGMAEKLLELVSGGATVIGGRPREAATLGGGAASDARLEAAVRKLWGDGSRPGVRKVGRGRVVSGLTLDEALKRLSVEPDVTDAGELQWLHRTAKGADWYFVSVPEGRAFEGTVGFRAAGRVQIWDPVSGGIRDLPSVERGGRSYVALNLPVSGSCFLVFRRGVPVRAEEPSVAGTVPLSEPWTLRFPEGWGAPSALSVDTLRAWKALDLPEEGRAFSGTVAYETTFDVGEPETGARYVLDLGRVESIARVVLNGETVRTLWTYPYEADITERLRPGRNTLSVQVTDTWFNRLAFDAGRPEECRKTWVLRWPDRNAPLKESGLLGPVSVRVLK